MRRIIVFLLIIAAILFTVSWLDLHQLFTLSQLKQQQHTLQQLVAQNMFAASIIYFLCYVGMAGLAIPGALIMTLAGGALFGLLTGVLLVSFASSLGALIAFWAARFFLHDYIQSKYKDRLTVINDKIKQQGHWYLLFIRLVPAFPFFLVNVLMGLTPIRAGSYYLVSQIGMLPATIIYVNAGTELAKISSPQDILSWPLLISLTLLGLLPFITQGLVKLLTLKRLYAKWRKPKQFDYHTIVIGAGAAGLVSAYTSATLQAKVALIEQSEMGGDCLNTGCVPSKSILRTAKFVADLSRHQEFGIDEAHYKLQFSNIMRRVHNTVATIAPKDSIQRYSTLGVDCFSAEASLISPWQVELNQPAKHTLTAKNIIVASGAQPAIPTITGLDEVDYYTSDSIWNLTTLPQELLIIGAGPIACELGLAFARLGTKVTLVNRGERILANEDHHAAQLLHDKLTQAGLRILNNFFSDEFSHQHDMKCLVGKHEGQSIRLNFTHLLLAVGRTANTAALAALDIDINQRGQIVTNQFMQTNYPNIYACGDVTSPLQYTHSASHQAWYAAFNALFRPLKQFKCALANIPRAIYTDPEIASLGITEQQAIEQGIKYQVTTLAMDDIDRAITDSATDGFVKVITADNSDKILGVCIVGEHASELIAEFVLAKTHNLGLNKILQTVHLYPTRSEINRLAAGKWRRSRFSAKSQQILHKIQLWRLRN